MMCARDCERKREIGLENQKGKQYCKEKVYSKADQTQVQKKRIRKMKEAKMRKNSEKKICL